MTDPTPRLEPQTHAAGQHIVLLGRWGAAELGQRGQWQRLQRQLAGHGTAAVWDLTQLAWLDHLGAQLLWQHWQGQWPAQLHTHPSQRAMLERVARFASATPPAQRPYYFGRSIEHLGTLVLAALGHGRDILLLIGGLWLDALRLLRAPHKGPWRDFSGHLFNMGATALPITALVGFLMGEVLD